MNIKWLCLVSGALLLLGIPAWWPYVFYTILRWIIFLSASVVAYESFNSKFKIQSIIFLATAFLFNPFYPVILDKSIWIILDFLAAIVFFITSFFTSKLKVDVEITDFAKTHPLITSVLAIILLVMVWHWLNQPMKVIYDPTAPPY
jgi:hypothetical protein